MALPQFVQAGTGVAITGASGSATITGTTPGNIIVMQYLLDGTNAFGGITGVTNAENLNGDSGSLDFIAGMQVGGTFVAAQRADIGRSTGADIQVDFGSVTDDIFVRLYEFSGVVDGATVATVIENDAGTNEQNQGTSTTIADPQTISNGDNRLAVALIAANADVTLGSFTGETGGDWEETVAAFSSSAGTAGSIGINTAELPTATTIDGGTMTITSAAWGVMTFCLLPGSDVDTGLAWITA